MEEDILKIIHKYGSVDWSVSSKEIASLFREFIQWLVLDIEGNGYFMYSHIEGDAICFCEEDTEPFRTLDYVYQYWKDNIKTR